MSDERTIWRHLKTGHLYQVVCEATIETTMTPAIIYGSPDQKRIWVRPKDEFYDGRFVKLSDEEDAAVRAGRI